MSRDMYIHFDAKTTSEPHNDGQEEIHSAIRYAWEDFTGGFINSTRCDPEWHIGRPTWSHQYGKKEGVPVARHWRTYAIMRENSASEFILDELGEETFCALLLQYSPNLRRVITDKGITNFRLERVHK
jgi:hypothetical protein